MIHAGTYSGGVRIANLRGTAERWITITSAPGQAVIFEGGEQAIHFSDPEYVRIIGLTFQQQTANGVNIDDGGTYATPAHHVIIERCTFRDIAGSGNNDLLKLSGVDYFEVRNCLFLNGAAGGSGIDMVGCHHGIIAENRFENMGSNSVQCKGGSEFIRIERNFFKNGGQRTLNLGGSTGLQYFRPDTARFEAARIKVYANIIVGSQAPIAYVGAIEVDVAHNTLVLPERWAVRVLQETVDSNRFVPCGYNSFRNNIVVVSNALRTAVNIGPNTAPETFVFSHNLWYNLDNSNWQGPNPPVPEPNRILNQDPLFTDRINDNFMIPPNSPAAGRGMILRDPQFDYFGRPFANPPSIGAIEANPVSSAEVELRAQSLRCRIFPNPAPNGMFSLYFPSGVDVESLLPLGLSVVDLRGRVVHEQSITQNGECIRAGNLPPGVYFLRVAGGSIIPLVIE